MAIEISSSSVNDAETCRTMFKDWRVEKRMNQFLDVIKKKETATENLFMAQHVHLLVLTAPTGLAFDYANFHFNMQIFVPGVSGIFFARNWYDSHWTSTLTESSKVVRKMEKKTGFLFHFGTCSIFFWS